MKLYRCDQCHIEGELREPYEMLPTGWIQAAIGPKARHFCSPAHAADFLVTEQTRRDAEGKLAKEEPVRG